MFLLFRVYALFQQEYVVNVVTKLFFLVFLYQIIEKYIQKEYFIIKLHFCMKIFLGTKILRSPEYMTSANGCLDTIHMLQVYFWNIISSHCSNFPVIYAKQMIVQISGNKYANDL